jgi:formamidopyrimidine-DNA glycosylase
VVSLSIELPEAYILAKQMTTELTGKTVAAFTLQNCAKYQDLGFINTHLSDFQRLCNHRIESVVSRGNTIRVKLDGTQNLLLAPEYGGTITYHPNNAKAPSKFTLKLHFKDETALTVTLTGMGIIQAHSDGELENSYVYRRDFSATASPLDANFTFARFSRDLAAKNVNLKTALVGKDATVVGLGNSAFQDIIYLAKLHPKRKASELSQAEQHSLFNAIQFMVQERIKLGGKDQFVDLYGKQGRYVAAMGPNMKGKICSSCGGAIEKLSFAGGQIYLCPRCQK